MCIRDRFAVSLLGQRWRDGRRSLWLSGPGMACGLVGVVGAALLVEGVPFMGWMAAIAAAGNVVLALAALGAGHVADAPAGGSQRPPGRPSPRRGDSVASDWRFPGD